MPGRFVSFLLMNEGDGQVVMQDGLGRLQSQCRATAAFRIRKIAKLPVYRAQQEPGFGILRPLFTEAGTCFLRLGVALLLEQIFYLRLVHYQYGFFKKSYMCFGSAS
jgi:hypothetical protein